MTVTTTPSPGEILGENIRLAREAAGLSQQELAKALKISYQAVQAWEHGRTSPVATKIPEICKLCSVSPNTLFYYRVYTLDTPAPITEEDNARLAARFAHARESAGLSQVKLASMVGVSQNAISQIESGETEHPKLLVEYANAMGVDVIWLVTGDNKDAQQKGGTPELQQLFDTIKSMYHTQHLSSNALTALKNFIKSLSIPKE